MSIFPSGVDIIDREEAKIFLKIQRENLVSRIDFCLEVKDDLGFISRDSRLIACYGHIEN